MVADQATLLLTYSYDPFHDLLHSAYALTTHRIDLGNRSRRLSNQLQLFYGQDGTLTTSRTVSLFALFTYQRPPVTTG